MASYALDAAAWVARQGLRLTGAGLDLLSRFMPPPQVAPARHRRAYDGAVSGYRTNTWQTNGNSANAEILASLSKLRERSRDLTRNNPYGRRAVEALASNLIGTGVRPMPVTGDDGLDTRIADLWDRWQRRCYPSSRLGIYGVQTLLARSFFTDGEVLVRRRPRRMADMSDREGQLPPIQIQALEADFLPIEKSEALPSGGRIEQGVEFDVLDRRRYYHLLRSHPGGSLLFGSVYGVASPWDTVRVPANDVIHLMQETRPGQCRGVPWLSPVILSLWDHQGYTEAERVRAKSASMLFAMVEGSAPETEDDLDNPDGIGDHTDENGNLVTDASGYVVEALRPGMVAYLPNGKKIAINQPGTAAGYADYVRASIREVAAGLGLSYEVLTQDLSQVNFSSIRLGLLEQHRLVRALREQVLNPLVMDPIYEWFVDAAISAGLLPDDPACYRVEWSVPQIESAARKEDAEAVAIEIRNGLSSLWDEIAARGKDPEKVLRDINATNALLDELKLTLDSDPRRSGKPGAGAPAP